MHTRATRAVLLATRACAAARRTQRPPVLARGSSSQGEAPSSDKVSVCCGGGHAGSRFSDPAEGVAGVELRVCDWDALQRARGGEQAARVRCARVPVRSYSCRWHDHAGWTGTPGSCFVRVFQSQASASRLHLACWRAPSRCCSRAVVYAMAMYAREEQRRLKGRGGQKGEQGVTPEAVRKLKNVRLLCYWGADGTLLPASLCSGWTRLRSGCHPKRSRQRRQDWRQGLKQSLHLQRSHWRPRRAWESGWSPGAIHARTLRNNDWSDLSCISDEGGSVPQRWTLTQRQCQLILDMPSPLMDSR